MSSGRNPALAQLPPPPRPGTPFAGLRLDANEAPPLTHPDFLAALARGLQSLEVSRYPPSDTGELREALAGWLSVESAAVVVGAGSDEILSLLTEAWCAPPPGGEKPVALMPSPSFVMFRRRPLLRGWDVVEVPLREDWEVDAAALLEACDRHRPNLVFLASPNNPTGRPVPPGVVLSACARAPHGLVVLDEAYAAFSRAGTPARPGPDNLVRVGTLSKVGLAALRVGWAEAAPHVVTALDAVRAPFSVAAASQKAAAAVLREAGAVLRDHARACAEEREQLARRLEALGTRVTPSEANFLWVCPRSGAESVHARLLGQGVRVWRQPGPVTGGWLRVTVGTAAENALLLEAWASSDG